jgi:ubiquinone/menaquinone biosynthesis methyltransferase
VSVIGDFSLGMLQKAPAKKVQAHPIQSDALGLPFKSNSFSKVFCGFGVRNLSDLSQGISEVYRVLQPGGVFLVLEFFKPETPWSRFFYNGLAPVVLPPLAGIFRTPKSAYEYLVKSIRAFASVEEFKNKAFEKGFTQGYRIHCDGGVCSIVLLRKPPVPEIPWADI